MTTGSVSISRVLRTMNANIKLFHEPMSCMMPSADGRHMAFKSRATNLVADDTNGYDDVFVRGPLIAAPASPFTAADAARFNVETGNALVTLVDAVRIARKMAGLETNP